MPRLTDDLARSAAPAPSKSETVIYDDAIQGFGLRVRSSGAKTWIWRRRRPDGRPERYTIGSWPSTRAAAAREIAKQRDAEWTAEAHGVPVERIDRTRHRQARREPTLGELADEWLEAFERLVSEGRRRETTLEEYRRHLTRDIAVLRRRPAKALTREDVTAALVALEAERGRSAAVGARATLSSLCSWAIKRARLDLNPVVGSYKPDGAGDRERVLTDNELREVWQAADEHGGDFGALVKLLSLTGQRRQEIGGLRWSEVDEGQTRLDLPGWRMKNGLPHLVPLSSAALELLRATPRTTRDGDPHQLVFGRGSSGFRGWSHAKQQLDIRLAKKRAARAGAEIELPSRGEAPAKDQWRLERATLKALERFRLPVWRLHDLRRTFVTRCNDLGLADPHVIDAFVGHISGQAKAGVAGVYNRAIYLPQRVELANRWAEHVLRVVSESDST